MATRRGGPVRRPRSKRSSRGAGRPSTPLRSLVRRLPRSPRGRAALAGGLALIIGGTFWAYWMVTPHCPDGSCPALGALHAYRPPEPPLVYDASDRLVGQLPGPRRVVVELHETSPLLREGFVAVEDRRFREHDGVDLVGALRAALRNLAEGGVREGASTIHMQLARNVYQEVVGEQGIWHRKLTEIRVAREIDAQLSKDEILELYLNQIYLGDGVYGVETAARHYFGKSSAEVTPAEAAVIIGLAQSPSGYNPRRHPERALARRDVVLGVLEREGVITPETAEEARASELGLVPSPFTERRFPYYFARVAQEVREIVPEAAARNGLQVHTGLVPEVQERAQSELRRQIERIESGTYGGYRHPVPTGDDLEERSEGSSPYLQGMVVSMDPATGLVHALVGGRAFEHSEFDRAFLARRQAGSAFKPILYAAALERGVSLAEPLPTSETMVVQVGSESWTPRDEVGDTVLSVRDAIALSSNSAAVRVGQRIGISAVAAKARALGISDPIPPYPASFLGAAEVVPAELVGAYAAIVNGGTRVTPHLVHRIEDAEGTTIWEAEPSGTRVLDAGVAFLLRDAMEDVVSRGTGWRAREGGYWGRAAGKTGTTDEGKDVWFIGGTPDLVMGVWLGFDRPSPILRGASGGLLAAPVWGHVVAGATVPPKEDASWKPPANVVQVVVDPATGLRVWEGCARGETREEYFLLGFEPIEASCPTPDQPLERLWRGFKSLFGGNGGS